MSKRKCSTCPTRDDDVTCPECGIVYAPAWGHPDGTGCVLDPERAVAADRDESEPCERGTVGCSVRHVTDSKCQPW